MSKELLEAVELFISQPLNNPLSRGQIMEVARIALPILEQQERGEGWIEWGGGVMPVNRLVMIEPKLRIGNIMPPEIASYWDWKQSGGDSDIIAYRIIPDRATNQNGEQ